MWIVLGPRNSSNIVESLTTQGLTLSQRCSDSDLNSAVAGAQPLPRGLGGQAVAHSTNATFRASTSVTLNISQNLPHRITTQRAPPSTSTEYMPMTCEWSLTQSRFYTICIRVRKPHERHVARLGGLHQHTIGQGSLTQLQAPTCSSWLSVDQSLLWWAGGP
jgi:hypothetical protein